jgi:hypothetical protein
MKPSVLTALVVVVCTGACARGTGRGISQAQGSSPFGRAIWKGEDNTFISTLSKKQDFNLVRLARHRAAERALEKQAESARRVPPGMSRATEPPLPEPDLSLPVPDVPGGLPNRGPAPAQ